MRDGHNANDPPAYNDRKYRLAKIPLAFYGKRLLLATAVV